MSLVSIFWASIRFWIDGSWHISEAAEVETPVEKTFTGSWDESPGAIGFETLLATCVDEENPAYDLAWREFQNRYHDHIRGSVLGRCNSWKSRRLSRQRVDVVDDIVLETYFLLRNKLSTYRVGKGGDRAFRSWLATLCRRAASNYLKRQLSCGTGSYIDEYYLESASEKASIYDFVAVEVFEDVVIQLRNTGRDKSKNRELQINLFLQMTMFDLPEDTLLQFHPLLKDGTPAKLKNIKHRSRQVLRKNGKWKL